MDLFKRALLTAVYFANNGSPKAHSPIERIVNQLPVNIRNNSKLRKNLKKVMNQLRSEGFVTSKTGRTNPGIYRKTGISLVRSWG